MQIYSENEMPDTPARMVDDEYTPPLNSNWEEMTIDEVIAARDNAHADVEKETAE